MLSAKLQEFSAQNDALRKTTVELQVNNIYDSWNANFESLLNEMFDYE